MHLGATIDLLHEHADDTIFVWLFLSYMHVCMRPMDASRRSGKLSVVTAGFCSAPHPTSARSSEDA
jgi:hypothetical protein